MRRLLAIAVIIALICSTGMPVWASVCETHKAAVCHREAAQGQVTRKSAHHCASMDMADERDAAPVSESDAFAKGGSSDCPMQCCAQATAGTGIAVASAALIAGLISSEDQIYVPAVAFSTPGYSSHTDRGPPAA